MATKVLITGAGGFIGRHRGEWWERKIRVVILGVFPLKPERTPGGAVGGAVLAVLYYRYVLSGRIRVRIFWALRLSRSNT